MSLFDSSFLKDLYAYKNVIENLHARSNSLGIYYPNKMSEFFEIVTSANCIPKSKQFKQFIAKLIKDRGIKTFFDDFSAFTKCGLDVFLGK